MIERPSIVLAILKKKRGNMDEFIEVDYFDIYIYGRDSRFIGWIELANARDGKLPARQTLKWIELIASVLGSIIKRKNLENP